MRSHNWYDVMAARRVLIAAAIAGLLSFVPGGAAIAGPQCPAGEPQIHLDDGTPACGCPLGQSYEGWFQDRSPICVPMTSCPDLSLATISANGAKQCSLYYPGFGAVQPPNVPPGPICKASSVIVNVPSNTWIWKFGCTQGSACPTGWIENGQVPGACFMHCSANTPKDFLTACGCPAGEKEVQTYTGSIVTSSMCVSVCPANTQWNTTYGACTFPTNYGCTPPAVKINGFCLQCPVGQTYVASRGQCGPASGSPSGSSNTLPGGSSTGATDDNEGASNPLPSSPIGSGPHSCPAGQSWNGLHCMNPAQPNSGGSNEGSGAVMPSTTIGGGQQSCPSGMVWNGLRCMNPTPPAANSTGPCPPLSTWTGEVCIGPRGKAFCPEGETLQGGVCVAAIASSPCPPLSTWTGEVCVGPRGKLFCPERETLQGRVCVANRTASPCPPLSTWTGEVCVGPRGKLFCPEGETLQGRVCVANRAASPCPPLSTWTGGVCIGPRGKAFCPEGMTMNGRVCVR